MSIPFRRPLHSLAVRLDRASSATQRAKLARCGRNVTIEASVVVHAPKHVEIGDDCMINDYVVVLGKGGVVIGDSVLIAHHASIISESHEADSFSPRDAPPLLARVTIGNRVWIGAGARILPGISIGDGAIVAAGAVVTTSVPKDAVVAGVPARVIRYKVPA